MTSSCQSKQNHPFPLGHLCITPNAEERIPPADVAVALRRHARCDWGDCCKEDAEENEISLKEGWRLFSVFHAITGEEFWIITEADRSVTTILLPEDY